MIRIARTSITTAATGDDASDEFATPTSSAAAIHDAPASAAQNARPCFGFATPAGECVVAVMPSTTGASRSPRKEVRKGGGVIAKEWIKSLRRSLLRGLRGHFDRSLLQIFADDQVEKHLAHAVLPVLVERAFHVRRLQLDARHLLEVLAEDDRACAERNHQNRQQHGGENERQSGS